MLQNLTKNDENFQSKFVVFPSLQRNATTSTTTTTTTSTTTTTTTTTTRRPILTRATMPRNTYRMVTPRRRPISLNIPKPAPKDESAKSEKITIVPQVFLQNDQTPMNDDSFERPADDAYNYQGSNRREVRVSYQKFSKNVASKSDDAKPAFLYTSTGRPVVPLRRRNQEMNLGATKKAKTTGRNGEKQLRRQMRKQCKQEPIERQTNCTKAFELKFNLSSSQNRKGQKGSKNGEAMATSPTIEFSPNGSRAKNNYVPIRSIAPNNPSKRVASIEDEDEAALKQSILQRTIRSHHRHQRRNASATATRDFLYANGTPVSAAVNETSAEAAAAAYNEHIDLNPDLCYKVDGLSFGQQKLCVSHTQIMPAVSRGARAAIQVIQSSLVCFSRSLSREKKNRSHFISYDLVLPLCAMPVEVELVFNLVID